MKFDGAYTLGGILEAQMRRNLDKRTGFASNPYTVAANDIGIDLTKTHEFFIKPKTARVVINEGVINDPLDQA